MLATVVRGGGQVRLCGAGTLDAPRWLWGGWRRWLADEDLYAANTGSAQDRVKLTPNSSAVLVGGTVRVELPAVSWTALALTR